jgi:Fic-DOC domain mobile mystery protein B/predicted DNA-binding mobile mystery protein A
MDRHKPGLVREQLDLSLAKLKPLGQTARPVKGWLRAIRTGLGMSGVQLARQLGVTPPRVVEMEKSEVDGAISLKVLERAAEAMGCSLVYALIPRAGSLEQTLRDQAKAAFADAALVSGISFYEPVGDPARESAPLDPEETGGLRLSHIATRGELRRWESGSVHAAEAWAFSRKRADLFSEKWIRQLHFRMFGQVWKSAGELRTLGAQRDPGRGSPPAEILPRLSALFENAAYWAKAKVYPPDEACARFHHRLASIRAFDQGSGRHARLMADLALVRIYGKPRFTWGGPPSGGAGEGETIKRYLEAMRAADARDFKPLLAFARA